MPKLSQAQSKRAAIAKALSLKADNDEEMPMSAPMPKMPKRKISAGTAARIRAKVGM